MIMKSSTTFTLIMYWYVAILLLILEYWKYMQTTLSFTGLNHPSFSGLNTSSVITLTIETRKKLVEDKLVKDEIEAYKDELARDASNTTLSQVHYVTWRSRIYAQLSRQMVEQFVWRGLKKNQGH